MIEFMELAQVLDDDTRIGVLMQTIEQVLDGLDNGTFTQHDADSILNAASIKLGFTFDDAFELIAYVNFRRNGTPPITIH